MREAGLLATINTDDPGMTDLDLGKEYRSVATAQGMPFEEVAAVALDGIEASWLDDGDKRAMRADKPGTQLTAKACAHRNGRFSWRTASGRGSS